MNDKIPERLSMLSELENPARIMIERNISHVSIFVLFAIITLEIASPSLLPTLPLLALVLIGLAASAALRELSIRNTSRTLEGVKKDLLELKEDQIQITSLIQSLPILIYSTDQDGNIDYCNASFASLFGFEDQSELIGENISGLFVEPAHRKLLLTELDNRGGEISNYLVYVKKKSGEKFYLSVHTVWRDSDSKTGTRGSGRDVFMEQKLFGPYLQLNSKRVITFCNEEFSELISSSSPETIIGRELAEVLGIGPRRNRQLYEDLSKAEGNYTVDLKIDRESPRSNMQLEFVLRPISTSESSIVGYEGIIRDITSKKELEEKESEFLNIINRVHDLVFRIDSNSTIEYCNPAFQRKFGLDSNVSQIPGMKFDSLLRTKSDYGRFKDALKMAHGRLSDFRLEGKRTDGTSFILSLDAHIHEDSSRQDDPMTIEAIARDVTKNLDYKLLVELSSEGICVVQNELIKLINPRFSEMFECNDEEAIGSRLEKFIELKNNYKVHDITEKLSLRPGQISPPIAGLGKKSSAKFIYLDVLVANGEYDNKSAIICSIRDLTLVRKLDEQKEQNRKMIALGESATHLAHTMNQPLQIISLLSSGLIRRMTGKEREKAKQINEEVVRLTEVITAISEFVKPVEFNFQKEDLRDVILTALRTSSIQKRIRENQVDLNCTLDNVTIELDRIKLINSLVHIFNNALDEMPNGGKLQVKLRKETDKAIVQISDTGPGINTTRLESINDIFEPFVSHKSENFQGVSGHGFGLSEVKGVVTGHAGSITARNLVSGGAEFEIELPREQIHFQI